MKTMKIIYGSYIEIDGKTFYCKGYNVVEMKQMPRPYNYREMITRIAEITGDKFDNIFVEWVNGESLKNPIGFEK